MGKRRRCGGRSSSSSSSLAILRQRIVSSKLDASFDVDAVADHLRSLYPDYSRLALRPFTLQVRKTLDFFDRRNETLENDCNDDENRCRKRTTRKADESEERFLAAKSGDVRKQRLREDWNPNASSLVSSDDSTSISESDNAVFEARIDPEFDLTKSMLRDNYSKKSKFEKKEEHNMEVDAVDEKKRTMTMGNSQSWGESEIAALKDEYLTKGEVVTNERPRFKDMGGMKEVLEELMIEVIVPFRFPQLPRRLGVRPMTGILLHGPPGCGKTMLANAIANETGVPFYMISATEVVSGVSGVSEENIRDLFKKAYRTAPSIVFIDEIDAIASKRENLQREMDRRIVTQLMTCMDASYHTLKSTNPDSESETSDRKSGFVLVIGATNRPDAIDQALRRPGRFDREIALGVADENARLEILSVLTKKLRLEGEFNLMKIARFTPGFVGTDLLSLVNEAGILAMKRIIVQRKSEFKGGKIDEWWMQSWPPEEIERLNVTMSDFEAAVQMVQPSSRREGFSSIPSTRWEDVGGLKSLRKEFERNIVRRIKNPEIYEEFGVDMAVGFLLYGPPGCGKTLIAKAVANEAGANFIHIKGPELLDKYVGESELAVRTIFSRARTCSPCILLFDEVDALTTMRGKEVGSVVERLLTQLLIELDGADQRKGVYVIGTTNRLEVMDPAVLRPGRFGRILYAPLPIGEERGLILKALARKKPVAADVDLDALGRKEACHNLSGADLYDLMHEAAMTALEEKQMALDSGSSFAGPSVIETSHFEEALVKIAPSVSEEQRIYYETLSKKYRRRN